MKKLVAEFIGTLWLVLGGCGSAVLAAGFPELGIGFVGVALAFGLTVIEGMAMGKPVVATAAGGNVELVEEGVNGAHCSAAEIQDLIHKMEDQDTKVVSIKHKNQVFEL